VIRAFDFVEQARERRFRLYAGVPCSFLKPFINYVIDDDSLRYVAAANEGDAVAIAAGSDLGGVPAICMFQNSGLGNAVSPLSSLTATFRIPVLLIVTHRGRPGADPDEPQHELMGRITGDMLELLGIPSEDFPTDSAQVGPALDRATTWMREHSSPYALIMAKGSVEPWKEPHQRSEVVHPESTVPRSAPPETSRGAMLDAVQASVDPSDVVIAATGYTGRELYAHGDAPNQFYMVGSMGCASSLGLGLAISQPQNRVVVLDGDGAAIMRLGALATLGAERPANVVHIVLDNGQHESTGGQPTSTATTDLAGVAVACGYRHVERATSAEGLSDLLRERLDGPLFIHVPIHPGVPEKLPRPAMTPPEVAARFRRHLHDHATRQSSDNERPPGGQPSRRRMKILVLTKLFPDAMDQLRRDHDVVQHIDPSADELLELVGDREVLIFRSGVQITAEVMGKAQHLELLIRGGSGLDNIDLDHADENGIELVRIPQPGARAVAELAFALILNLARRVLEADSLLRQGRWAKHDIVGRLLADKTLGVYGAGNVGGEIGQLGRAWGMKVLGCVEHPTDTRARRLAARGIELVSDAEVLARSDFLTLSVPLKPSTRQLIDAEAIAAMKPGAFIVNVARGGVVDEAALAEALDSGHLAGAALDVHEREGEGEVSLLAARADVVLTPHIGAGTVDSQRMIGDRIVEILDERAARLPPAAG
jgi:phosphonopyruvate decarboxylase